jgi:ankyrin repeat protein
VLSKLGDTALIYAAENGYFAIADLLLRAGADINRKNKVSFYFITLIARVDHLPYQENAHLLSP